MIRWILLSLALLFNTQCMDDGIDPFSSRQNRTTLYDLTAYMIHLRRRLEIETLTSNGRAILTAELERTRMRFNMESYRISRIVLKLHGTIVSDTEL